MNVYFKILNEINVSRTNMAAFHEKEDTKTPSFAMTTWET